MGDERESIVWDWCCTGGCASPHDCLKCKICKEVRKLGARGIWKSPYKESGIKAGRAAKRQDVKILLPSRVDQMRTISKKRSWVKEWRKRD